jgi:hypothetical protein
MVIRKTSRFGIPIYVAIITDDNLDTLDKIIDDFLTEKRIKDAKNIQEFRNIAGGLTEHLYESYSKIEGAAVIMSADKCMISSLYGDFMTHAQCRLELFSLLNMSCHV